MKDLMTFNFDGADFRALRDENGEPWFVGKDVAELLGYERASDTIRKKVEDDDKGVAILETPGGKQQVAIINESGLYSLILSSKLESAKRFKRIVTNEILPAIRKHGGYLTDAKIEEVLLNPDTIISLATQLKEEREKRLKLETEAIEAKPKVLFADSVSASETCILIGDLAKLIHQNGQPMGRERLFEKLRNDGWLIKQNGMSHNMPTQKAMEKKLFRVKETTISHSDGHITISKTVKVTGEGQIFFINRYSHASQPVQAE